MVFARVRSDSYGSWRESGADESRVERNVNTPLRTATLRRSISMSPAIGHGSQGAGICDVDRDQRLPPPSQRGPSPLSVDLAGWGACRAARSPSSAAAPPVWSPVAGWETGLLPATLARRVPVMRRITGATNVEVLIRFGHARLPPHRPTWGRRVQRVRRPCHQRRATGPSATTGSGPGLQANAEPRHRYSCRRGRVSHRVRPSPPHHPQQPGSGIASCGHRGRRQLLLRPHVPDPPQSERRGHRGLLDCRGRASLARAGVAPPSRR